MTKPEKKYQLYTFLKVAAIGIVFGYAIAVMICVTIVELLGRQNLFAAFILDQIFIVSALIDLILISLSAHFYSRAYYQNYSYELGENELKKSYGVFVKNNITIPYKKIQNVDITINPLENMIGLATISISTAGVIGQYVTDRQISGLTLQTATSIKEELMKLSKLQSGQGL